MGRYAGYIAILLALIAGLKTAPPYIIVPLALFSTMFMVRGRRDIDKNKTKAAPPNPIIDGMFLFSSQLMIVFLVYLLGYFSGSEAGEYFAEFVKGGR